MSSAASSASGAKRRIPGTPQGGEREPMSPITPEAAKVARVGSVEHEISTPVPAFPVLSPSTEDMLSHIMKNMVVKDDLVRLQSNIETSVTEEIRHLRADLEEHIDMTATNVENIQTEVRTLKDEVGDLKKQIDCRVVHDGSAPAITLEAKVQKLQADLQALLHKQDPTATPAVIGGLDSLGSLDEGKRWIKNELWKEWLPQPVEMYCKGDYNGVVFAKFLSVDERDAVITNLKSSKKKRGNKTVWSAIDKPVEVRAPLAFLYGAKDLLVQWGEPKGNFWVDPDGMRLTHDGKQVVSVAVRDAKLCLDYGEGWSEYVQSQEWSNLSETASNKLDRKRAKGSGKGSKGKGKQLSKNQE